MSGPLDETPRDLLAPAACFGLCRPRWPLPVHAVTLAWMTLAVILLWPRVGPDSTGSGPGHVLLVALTLVLTVALVVSVLRVVIVWPQMGRRTPVPVTVHVERASGGDVLILAAVDGRAWQARTSDLALWWPRFARRSRPRWALQVRPLQDPGAHPVPEGRRQVIAGELIFPHRSRTVGLVLHRRHITSDVLPELATEDGADLEPSERWQRFFNYIDFVDHSDCHPLYMVRARFTAAAGPSTADPTDEEASAEIEDATSLDGALHLLQVKVRRGDEDAADAMSLFRSIAQADAQGKVVDPRRRAHLATMLRNQPEPDLIPDAPDHSEAS
jgi:hypothetical protein